jgi:hypothetical protein
MIYCFLPQFPFVLFSFELLIRISCVAAWMLIMLPLIFYLFTLWRARRDNLIAVLTPESLGAYYRQFYPGTKIDETNSARQFKQHFDRLYGRYLYAAPLLVLALVSGIAAWSCMDTLLMWSNPAGPSQPALPGMIVAAFAGAFWWVITDEFDQIRKRDVTHFHVWLYSLRVLISVPFGWALGHFVRSEVGIPLAFLLGAFPTKTLLKVARRVGERHLGLADDPILRGAELEHLQCVGTPAAERFREEGVDSIVDLAYKDPIDLTIRTNFDFNYVIDCVSQALLWIYFGNETKDKELYKLSMRGAQEVASLIRSHDNYHEAIRSGITPDELVEREHNDVERAINEVAGRLGISDAALMVTLRQVANDPYTKFLCALWGAIAAPEVPKGKATLVNPAVQKNVA